MKRHPCKVWLNESTTFWMSLPAFSVCFQVQLQHCNISTNNPCLFSTVQMYSADCCKHLWGKKEALSHWKSSKVLSRLSKYIVQMCLHTLLSEGFCINIIHNSWNYDTVILCGKYWELSGWFFYKLFLKTISRSSFLYYWYFYSVIQLRNIKARE